MHNQRPARLTGLGKTCHVQQEWRGQILGYNTQQVENLKGRLGQKKGYPGGLKTQKGDLGKR